LIIPLSLVVGCHVLFPVRAFLFCFFNTDWLLYRLFLILGLWFSLTEWLSAWGFVVVWVYIYMWRREKDWRRFLVLLFELIFFWVVLSLFFVGHHQMLYYFVLVLFFGGMRLEGLGYVCIMDLILVDQYRSFVFFFLDNCRVFHWSFFWPFFFCISVYCLYMLNWRKT
jgi:hypothetical protein